ncbi:MAG: histidine kinase N-terminal 7TM domain-containing protein [Anaerolineales bacterium]
MTWQINLFAIIYFFSAALVLVAIIFSFRHIQVRGARYFIYLSLSVEIWALFMGLEYGVVEPTWKIIFGKIQYLGIATIGVTWLMFALNYSRRNRWLTRRNRILLFTIPAITLAAVFTNELHGLLWPNITPSSSLPGASLVYAHGPVFSLIFLFNYIVLAIGTIVIVDNALRSRDLYRWQMIGLIISVSIPWIGNLIYVAGLSPVPGLDLTPIGFSLGAITISFSIFYFGLFDLVPVARDQLVENLLDGMLVLDLNNRVADINPKARELMKIGAQRVVGRPISDFADALELVGPFHGVESAQVEIQVKESFVSDIELRISPLVDENGKLAGRLFIARDISERKQVEKMRDNLTHAMIHDLRNPLAIITLSLDLLKSQLRTTLDKEQLITFETAEESTQHITDLVKSLLDISRLESGQMPLKRGMVSLQRIATDALKTQILVARKKRVLLQENIASNILPVALDEELMKRVFQNLLDNAVKFSVEGGVVRICASYRPAGQGIVVSVSDTGAGIDADVKNRIFEKFVTGNVKGSGSGLGLAFCRLVVEAHGGRIWVDETSDVGTTISLSIPI